MATKPSLRASILTHASFAPGNYSYRFVGQGELAIVDADIQPLPGNENPFLPGANRLVENRKYRQEFVMTIGEPEETNPEAMLHPFRDDNPIRYAVGIMNSGPLSQNLEIHGSS